MIYGEHALEMIRLLKHRGILVTANNSEDPPLLFLHRTFQEYLAARALASEPNAIAVVLKHLYDPAWHEVLVLLGGLCGDQVRNYIATLMRANQDDLFCRPLNLALEAATEAGKENLPKVFLQGMVELIGKMFLTGGRLVRMSPGRFVPFLGDYLEEACLCHLKDNDSK